MSGILHQRCASYYEHKKGLKMRRFSYLLSTFLALAGVTCSVLGILNESLKAAAIGMILIFGAGVFATLYLGSRRNGAPPI